MKNNIFKIFNVFFVLPEPLLGAVVAGAANGAADADLDVGVLLLEELEGRHVQLAGHRLPLLPPDVLLPNGGPELLDGVPLPRGESVDVVEGVLRQDVDHSLSPGMAERGGRGRSATAGGGRTAREVPREERLQPGDLVSLGGDLQAADQRFSLRLQELPPAFFFFVYLWLRGDGVFSSPCSAIFSGIAGEQRV